MNTRRIVAVLEKAAARIASGWTQHEYARNSDGLRTNSQDPHATSWCAEGAVMASTKSDLLRVFALDFLRRGAGIEAGSILFWNDERGRTRRQVLAAFRRAIRLLEVQHDS